MNSRLLNEKFGGLATKSYGLLRTLRSKVTVEPVVFLYMFAVFLSYSAFQQLSYKAVCERTLNCTTTKANGSWFSNASTEDSGDCSINQSAVEQAVETETSHWVLYVNLAAGVPSILVSVFVGGVSDHLGGRKPFLILPAIGSVLNASIILMVVYLHVLHPLPYFLVGALFMGLLGNFSIFNIAAFSYVADVSSSARRTMKISIVESMTFLGMTLSSLVSGPWLKLGHYGPPYIFIIVCHIIVVLYVLVVLPSSTRQQAKVVGVSAKGSSLQDNLENHSQAPTRLSRDLPLGIFENIAKFGSLMFQSWRISLLFAIFFVVEINFMGITDTVILYSLGSPLCWKSDFIGYFLALKVFFNGVVTLFVLPLLTLAGFADTTIILVGLVSGAAGLVLMGFASKTWIMFLGIFQCVCGGGEKVMV